MLVDTPVDTPKLMFESSSSIPNVEVMSHDNLIVKDSVSISTVHHEQLFSNIGHPFNLPESTDHTLSNLISSNLSNNNESTVSNEITALIDITDPGNWPSNIKDEIRIEIVKIGSCKVLNYSYSLSFDLNNEGR